MKITAFVRTIILLLSVVVPVAATALTVQSPVISSTKVQMTQGALSGTQGDAPGTAYPGGSYWLATHWDYAAGGLKHTLMSGSLNIPYSSIAWVKSTCVRNGNNYCVNGTVGSPAFTIFATGLTDVVNLWFMDLYWPSPGVTAEVLAFIHEENVGNSGGVTGNREGKTRIGLAWSSDSGTTWKYLGRIISAYGDPQPFNIIGAPYIVNNGYLYVYYSDKDTNGNEGIGVSRANISSVITAARAGNLGTNLWHKYYNNVWTELSLGGRPSFPTNQWGITHTQAVHSSYTGKYYMPLYFMSWGGINTSVKLYESSDGLSWIPSMTLVDEPASSQGPSGGYQYCSLVDVNGTANHEVGQKFHVYCLKNNNGEVGGGEYAQYRWTVNLGSAGDYYRQSVDWSSTQGPIWYYQYGTGLTNMNWNSAGYWQGQDQWDRIYSNAMHPGTAEGPVLKWVAPRAGTVFIGGTVRDSDPLCGDGINAQLVHNGTSIFFETIVNGNTVGKSPNLTRTVSAGDGLFFMIGARSNNYCDSTYWDPSIIYQ